MMTALIVLTLLAYVVAFYLWWADRTLRPLLLLLAGTIATLLQPLWGRLFENMPDAPGYVIRFGEVASMPVWTAVGGGVLLALPPLLIIYGLRHGWWYQHYVMAWGFFIAFVAFFLIFDALQTRAGIRLFARPVLVAHEQGEIVLHAMLLAAISFSLLYAFVSTRHFALEIAMLPLLLSGISASILLFGILCSPLWVAGLLNQPELIRMIAAAVSGLLLLWAVHLLASGLHEGRRQHHLQWR